MKKKLNIWEEGEDDGKWLKKLRRRLDNKEWGEDEEQKGRWEGSVKKLEEEKMKLENDKKDKWVQYRKLQDALVEFGEKEKGNEQIA